MEKAYLPESLEEAKNLVERLPIDDVRVFCSTFGLDSYGTKEELKLNLMTYYRSHFDPEIEAKSQAYVEEYKNTLSRLQNISLERHLGDSEEQIIRVENSIHEMQSSIKPVFH